MTYGKVRLIVAAVVVASLEEKGGGAAEVVVVEGSFFFFRSPLFFSSARLLGPRREVQGRPRRRWSPPLPGGAVEVGLLRPGRGREARAGVQGSAEALKKNFSGFFFF